GFYLKRGLIHTSPSPVARCPVCRSVPVRVHNVPLREYSHSEVFLGRRHARELWLPFLWGLPADELNDYLDDLNTAAGLLRDRRWNEAEEIIDCLFGKRFTWTHGKTLRNFIIDILRSRISLGVQLPDGLSEQQIVKEARLMLPVITADALTES